MSKFNELIQALETNQYVFIDIFDMVRGEYIAKNMFAKDLKANHATIREYFESLHNDKGVTKIQIQEYRKNGNAKRLTKPSFQITLEKAGATPIQQTPMPISVNQPHQAVVQKGMDLGIGLNGIGLNGLQMAKLLGVEERYDRLKLDYDELRVRKKELESELIKLRDSLTKEIRDNEAKYRSSLDLLEKELKAVKIDLATAEKQKELAVKETKLDQKSFWDSPAAEKIPDALMGFIPGNNQQQVVEATSGLTGASPIKQHLIDLIIMEQFTDAMAQETLFAATGIYKGGEFLNELRSLIQKHNLHNATN